jgi:polyadenylate-binding protein 2
MKQRVEEMEREAKKLRELQAAAESSATVEQVDGDEATPMETEDDKTAIDSRSVFVGNVRDILVPLWVPHNLLLRIGRL